LHGWWRAGEFDAALVQVVALLSGAVGGGEHVAGDVVSPVAAWATAAIGIQWSEPGSLAAMAKRVTRPAAT